MLIAVLWILGILAMIGEIIFIGSWIMARKKSKYTISKEFHPSVSIIVPCKGAGPNFHKNITAFCEQHYSSYRLYFIVDSKEDPAYDVLVKITKKVSHALIVFTEKTEGCSGKISALLTGIKQVINEDVLVFADADISPHKEWLTYLIAPLVFEDVGATTGYRWFFYQDFKSLLISTWNMVGCLSLYFPSVNYTWGGSTAIRRDLFDELRIDDHWKNGFSDDLILTRVVKKARYQIRFVPECNVESPLEDSFHSFLRFGSRQFTWVRWYYFSDWVLSLVSFIGLKIITVLGMILLLLGWPLLGLVMVSTVFFEVLHGWQAFVTIRQTGWYRTEQYGSAFAYALMMPVVFFVLAYNNIVSIFTRKIRWGGRFYRKRDVKKNFED